jgi:hypothetical protein
MKPFFFSFVVGCAVGLLRNLGTKSWGERILAQLAL